MPKRTQTFDVGEVFESGITDYFDIGFRPKMRRADAPLRPGITLASEAAEALVGCITSSPKVSDASLCVLANLLTLPTDQQFVFYSSDNNHYVGIGRYAPKWYRRKYIIEALRVLAADGLVEDLRTKPSPQAWYRSRVHGTERFLREIKRFPASAILFTPPELLVLRGPNGRPARYDDCDALRRARADVAEHNEMLGALQIEVDHPSASYDERGYLFVGVNKINPNQRAYYRIFNERFCLGGRYYGPWWQSSPSPVRGGIRIDGEPTIEADYRCCHLHLLFAACGEDLGQRDLYAETGLPRGEVKTAIQMMLNAHTPSSAELALRNDLRCCHGAKAAARSRKLMSRILDAFPRLARYWNTGCGLRLQNIDAQICMLVQRRLRKSNIACLSVHDSFIVQAKRAALLREIMGEELEAACKKLRQDGLEPPLNMSVDNF